jgi:hypothetical protein
LVSTRNDGVVMVGYNVRPFGILACLSEITQRASLQWRVGE